MKRILFIFLLGALLNISSLAQKSKILTDVEKSQIIKEILNDTVDDDFLNRGLRLYEKKDIVNLSATNLPHNFIPHKVKGVIFQLSSVEEVEEKSEYGFGFYVFQKFNINGLRMRVSFGNYWVNKSVGGFTSERTDYYYSRVSGKWKRIKKVERPNGMS